MTSGLASLAGYGSDSDGEVDVPVAATSQPSSSKLSSLLPPPKTGGGLASKLPPPASSSSSKASSLSLPPPKSSASSKRKVIKVDSLQSFEADGDGEDSEDAVEARAESKRPKLGGGSTSKHSLFGMLPAPKRKDDEVLAERSKQAEARKAAKAMEEADASTATQAPLRIDQDALRATSPDDQIDGGADGSSSADSKPKGKNNDAFRAMLGLKPAASKPRLNTPASTSSSASADTKLTTATQAASSKIQLPLPSPQSMSSSGQASSSKASAPVDFFSLDAPRSANGAASAATHTPTFSISAAPAIDHPESSSSMNPAEPADDEDPSAYPGWQLDPDGSWVPVTPEAHAQLLDYQQSLSPATPSSVSKSASNLDGTRDLLAAGLTPDDIRAFDASSAAQSYHGSSGDPADTEKYAAAAEFAAGNREVQQRKPGMLKGLRKGQLSSLVSLANENRAQLEERWKRGREAKAQRSSRYGF